jgi:hypothetical protein
LEAHGTLKASKMGLVKETETFAKLREKFIDCKPILDSAGIFLSRPAEDRNTKSVENFDLSVLMELEKYYKELDEIEDKVRYGGILHA